MQTLTAKLLNENLKKGWTEEDFANYLNVSVPQFNYLLNSIIMLHYISVLKVLLLTVDTLFFKYYNCFGIFNFFNKLRASKNRRGPCL